jgi:hypothetical protein
VLFSNPILQTMKEIEEFAIRREKIAKLMESTFDASDFIKQVEHTRITTHMNLREAFEYERKRIE